MNRFFVCLLIFFGTVFSSDKVLFLDCCGKNAQLPGTLQAILGALEEFENKGAAGVYVDLSIKESFFDTSESVNCIEQCFLPIKVGKGELERVPNYQKTFFRLRTYCEMSPKKANYLIQKYIKLKPEINQKFSEWLNRKHEVGVYFADPAPPRLQQAINHQDVIKTLMAHYQGGMIFLVTNDIELRRLVKKKFPGKVIVFFGYGFTVHEQVLLSLLVLSKCDVLIASDDPFSSCVSYFNPVLKTIFLDTHWLKSY